MTRRHEEKGGKKKGKGWCNVQRKKSISHPQPLPLQLPLPRHFVCLQCKTKLFFSSKNVIALQRTTFLVVFNVTTFQHLDKGLELLQLHTRMK